MAHHPAAPLCVCCPHRGAKPTASLHQLPLCAELHVPPSPQRLGGLVGVGCGEEGATGRPGGGGGGGGAGPLQKACIDTVALVTPHPPFFLSSSRCHEPFPAYRHISAQPEPMGRAETRGSRRSSGLSLSLQESLERRLLSLKGSVRKRNVSTV